MLKLDTLSYFAGSTMWRLRSCTFQITSSSLWTSLQFKHPYEAGKWYKWKFFKGNKLSVTIFSCSTHSNVLNKYNWLCQYNKMYLPMSQISLSLSHFPLFLSTFQVVKHKRATPFLLATQPWRIYRDGDLICPPRHGCQAYPPPPLSRYQIWIITQ